MPYTRVIPQKTTSSPSDPPPTPVSTFRSRSRSRSREQTLPRSRSGSVSSTANSNRIASTAVPPPLPQYSNVTPTDAPNLPPVNLNTGTMSVYFADTPSTRPNRGERPDDAIVPDVGNGGLGISYTAPTEPTFLQRFMNLPPGLAPEPGSSTRPTQPNTSTPMGPETRPDTSAGTDDGSSIDDSLTVYSTLARPRSSVLPPDYLLPVVEDLLSRSRSVHSKEASSETTTSLPYRQLEDQPTSDNCEEADEPEMASKKNAGGNRRGPPSPLNARSARNDDQPLAPSPTSPAFYSTAPGEAGNPYSAIRQSTASGYDNVGVRGGDYDPLPNPSRPRQQRTSSFGAGSVSSFQGVPSSPAPRYQSPSPGNSPYFQAGYNKSSGALYDSRNNSGYFGPAAGAGAVGASTDALGEYPQPMGMHSTASLDNVALNEKKLVVGGAAAGGKKGVRSSGIPPNSAEAASRKKRTYLIAGLAVLALILAIVIPVIYISNKNGGKTNNATAGGSGSGSSTSAGGSAGPSATGTAGNALPTTGKDGSTIIDENGNSFIYKNQFGGSWVSTPFDDSAQAQSDTPALNAKWDFSTMRIHGVNLGGWITLEPFISPALYEPFETATTPAVDEWTLCQNLGANMATAIENHYKTFITEQDFAQIAGAGLNWVRIPLPFWVIETYPGEPFLEGVGWKYFLKAITWARKYGIRINLDFHAVPGSQNGWNHSGRLGTVGFLNGVMGIANAQRTLNYIRTLAQFISQDEYKNVVQMFSVLNEAQLGTIGVQQMRSFYLQVYYMLRSISGIGEGNGPMMAIHDGFTGQNDWAGFLSGADRLALDTHPYLCFTAPNTDPLNVQALKPCQFWSAGYNTSFTAFGFSMAGEWSLAINDCGEYVNNVGTGTRFEGTYIAPGANAPAYARAGDCAPWNDYTTWSADTKAGLQKVAMGHMDALQNSFFWTWKIGNSTKTGRVANPLWSYSNGLANGYMPTNPRLSNGFCLAEAAAQNAARPPQATWAGVLSAWQTGGAGAGQLAAGATAQYAQWPPVSLQGIANVANLPTYTATGVPVTLPVSTPTAFPSGATATNPGNGWKAAADSAGYNVPISGCSYLNPWSGVGAAVPTAPCGGAAVANAAVVVATSSTTRRGARVAATAAPTAMMHMRRSHPA